MLFELKIDVGTGVLSHHVMEQPTYRFLSAVRSVYLAVSNNPSTALTFSRSRAVTRPSLNHAPRLDSALISLATGRAVLDNDTKFWIDWGELAYLPVRGQ